jgi:hypothetical protein
VKAICALCATVVLPLTAAAADFDPQSLAPANVLSNFLAGRFQWDVSDPLVAPARRPDDPCFSMKDPTVVFHEGRWHLFCTIRSQKRTHQIEYLNFADWKDADRADRHLLRVTDGYYCAPQVFYFTPHRKWYLIYQASDPTRKPALQPAFSTTSRLAEPLSWTPPRLLFDRPPENVSAWIDFWVICDAEKAHLFFTSLNGQMWRAGTTLDAFPFGWGKPEIVLRGDIFEASHTYRLKGFTQYLTLVEAQGPGGRRYIKTYLADRLDGTWTALAATPLKAFANVANARFPGTPWTQSFSHGELLRTGVDEKLEADPANFQFLFQGVLDSDRVGKKYGEIPWRLGILKPAVE